MSEINGVKIPAMRGSCWHAMLCGLAQRKNTFCTWKSIAALTKKYMVQYGGRESWYRFVCRQTNQGYMDRLKHNMHILTLVEHKRNFAYRLHSMGMCIYMFADGAVLYTDGTMVPTESGKYNVVFKDGRGLQVRYRGASLTYAEYCKYLDAGFVDISCRVLNRRAIRLCRLDAHAKKARKKGTLNTKSFDKVMVRIMLKQSFTQSSANRLELIGFVAERVGEDWVIGSISYKSFALLRDDPDILSTELVVPGENDDYFR